MLIEYGNTVVKATWELNEEVPTGYSRIYYVMAGDVTYESADTRQRLKPGFLYALPSTVPYHVWRDKKKDFICTYLHVDFSKYRVNSLIELPVEKDSCLSGMIATVAAAIREDCAAHGWDADDMVVFCDPARPDSIAELRTLYGINALPGINRDKVGRIGYIQGFKVRYVGANVREEADTYSWVPSKEDPEVFTDVPQDGGDHAMDAVSYGSTYLRRIGIPNDDGDLPA